MIAPIDGRYILSFGTKCFTAYILRDSKLRQFSGPFDWIFSNPAMTRHCLADDFKTFLDEKYHVSNENPVGVKIGKNTTHHSFYEWEMEVEGPIFNHYDLKSPEAVDYYLRCIGRVRELKASGLPTQLVQASSVHNAADVADRRLQFEETANFLSDLFPNMYLTQITIARPPGLTVPRLGTTARVGRHSLVSLEATSVLSGFDFEAAHDRAAFAEAVREYG